MTLPVTTITVIKKIGQAYVINIEGSTIIPTDTKNTAPKKSFSGLMLFSIRSINPVSAKIDPIINAPKAEENPE